MLNPEIIKPNIMGSLIADVVLLRHAPLLVPLYILKQATRMVWNAFSADRCDDCGSRCGAPNFTDADFCTKGPHLALACHSLADPSNSASIFLCRPFSLLAHLYFKT